MVRVVLMYLIVTGAIGGVMYAIPELRKFPTVHKRKMLGAASIGLILLILIYLGEQMP